MNSDQTQESKSQMAERFGTLQQRYRQHQAAMRGTTPNIPLTVMEMSKNENERENEFKLQRSRSNSMANPGFTNLPEQLVRYLNVNQASTFIMLSLSILLTLQYSHAPCHI